MKLLISALLFLTSIEFIKCENAKIYSLDEANIENLWSDFKSNNGRKFLTSVHETSKQ